MRLAVGKAEGRDAIGVFRPANEAQPAYIVVVDFQDDCVALIRDWRYVPYLMSELDFEFGVGT